jgi:ABC-type transport system involved in multi-copper enzyme maturation permease subunit
MRLLRGELQKLVRRPASYITLFILVAIILVMYISIGVVYTSAEQMGSQGAQARAGIELLLRFPDAYVGLLGVIVGLGGLLAVAYGAAAAGADWNWGMVKVAVARGESRSRYVLLKLAAVVFMLIPALVIAFAAGLLALVVAASIAGLGTAGMGDSATIGELPSLFVRSWWALAEQAAIGFAVATLARSQIAGLGAGIALFFVEQFLGAFILEYTRFAPIQAAQELISSEVGSSFGMSQGQLARYSLDVPTAFLFVTAYFALCAIVAAVFVERVDITG